MKSWRTMTLGDVAGAVSRYRPFLLVIAAVLVVAIVLPGETSTDEVATTDLDAAVGTNPTADAGTDTTTGTGAGTDTTTGAEGDTIATSGGPSGTSSAGGGGRTATGSRDVTLADTSGPVPAPEGKVVANCDAKTGRIAVPTNFAPPCVSDVRATDADSKWPGVTKDTIKVTLYRPQVDPATEAALTAAGAANTRDEQLETFKAYLDYFQTHYNLYGRKIELSIKEASGKSTDDAAAQADAIDIIKRIRPFAVLFANGGTVLNSFSQTLAANKVMCICGVSQPAEFYADQAPYLGYTTLMSSTQGYVHRSEYICKRLGQNPAKHAGFRDSPADPMADEKRVYGLLYYETNDKAYKSGIDFFDAQLRKCGIVLKNKLEFIYPLTSVQERASAMISRMKADGVTSVVFSGDPITPAIFTSEATKQRWFPEWIITGSALTDTTIFARTYDPQQWNRAFGISYLPARFPQEQGDSYKVHVWHHGTEPRADNTYGIIYSVPFGFFTGVHLAGPNLTPQSFLAGWNKYPPTGRGAVTSQLVSVGKHGIWGDLLDLTLYDDVTEIWWDPNAQGEDEVGNKGKGMYRYVDGGKRYLPGEHPTSPPRVFDPNGSPTYYDERPAADRGPEYPRPKK